MNNVPVVTGVAVVGSYRLRLLFDDGAVGDIDFSQREWAGVFEPMRDPAFFARVFVDREGGRLPGPGGWRWRPSHSTKRRPGITWGAWLGRPVRPAEDKHTKTNLSVAPPEHGNHPAQMWGPLANGEPLNLEP